MTVLNRNQYAAQPQYGAYRQYHYNVSSIVPNEAQTPSRQSACSCVLKCCSAVSFSKMSKYIGIILFILVVTSPMEELTALSEYAWGLKNQVSEYQHTSNDGVVNEDGNSYESSLRGSYGVEDEGGDNADFYGKSDEEKPQLYEHGYGENIGDNSNFNENNNESEQGAYQSNNEFGYNEKTGTEIDNNQFYTDNNQEFQQQQHDYNDNNLQQGYTDNNYDNEQQLQQEESNKNPSSQFGVDNRMEYNNIPTQQQQQQQQNYNYNNPQSQSSSSNYDSSGSRLEYNNDQQQMQPQQQQMQNDNYNYNNISPQSSTSGYSDGGSSNRMGYNDNNTLRNSVNDSDQREQVSPQSNLLTMNNGQYGTTHEDYNQISSAQQQISYPSSEATEIIETEKIEEKKMMDNMLQKVASSMEDKMKNMISGYLGSNNHKGNDMTQEEIQEVENEMSKRLENEVGNKLHMEGQKIKNDLLQQQPQQQSFMLPLEQQEERNSDNQEGSSNNDEKQQEEQKGNAVTNIIQQKLSTAGNALKDNMNSLMENIEKVTNEDIHSLNQQEDQKEEEKKNVAGTTHENDLNQEQKMNQIDNSVNLNTIVKNDIKTDDNPSNAIERKQQQQQQPEIEQPNETKEKQNESKKEVVNEENHNESKEQQVINEDNQNESKEDEAVDEEEQQNEDQQEQKSNNRFKKINNNPRKRQQDNNNAQENDDKKKPPKLIKEERKKNDEKQQPETDKDEESKNDRKKIVAEQQKNKRREKNKVTAPKK